MEFNVTNPISSPVSYQTYEPKVVPAPQSQEAGSPGSEQGSGSDSGSGGINNDNNMLQAAVITNFSKEGKTESTKNEKIDDSKPRKEESETQRLLEKAIQDANKRLLGTNNEFEYSYHKKTNRVSMKVVDAETKEVVKEIPPQRALDAVAKMWELAGIVLDEKK